MSLELPSSLNRVAARFAELAAEDPELRAGLRALGRALLALTEPAEAGPAVPAAEAPAPPEPPAVVPRESPRRPEPEPGFDLRAAAANLTFAQPEPAPPRYDNSGVPDAGDLALIAQRCRMKARGAFWAAERKRRNDAGVDYWSEVKPTDIEIIAQAKSIEGCYLWTNSPNFQPPDDLARLEDVARNYEVLASALDAVLAAGAAAGSTPPPAYELLAEAQSGLWASVHRVWHRNDHDQEQVFIWLREETARERIPLARHMSRDDAADPAAWKARAECVARFAAEIGAVQGREKDILKKLKNLKFITGQYKSGAKTLAEARESFLFAAETLLGLGVPPSHPELGELMLTLFDPNDAALAFAPGSRLPLVLREAGRRREQLGRHQASEPAGAAPVRDGPADVEDAVRRIEKEFPTGIAFALNSSSEVRNNPFEEPERLLAALKFLATTYRQAKLGEAECPDLNTECRRQSGFWYSPHQSDMTVGMYAEDYQATWQGRRLTLHGHLSKGQNKDARHTIRVGFDFDAERGVVVVGYIGQHQRTRAT